MKKYYIIYYSLNSTYDGLNTLVLSSYLNLHLKSSLEKIEKQLKRKLNKNILKIVTFKQLGGK